MVYQAPPEMGALWSKTNAMRDVIAAEQQKARKKRDAESWLRKEQERLQQEKVAYLVISILFLLYLWMLILFLGKIGKT
jgi:fatty acid desaturase